MKKLIAFWHQGQHWMREVVGNLLHKYKAIHSKHRQRAQARPWWKKELGELLSDLKQLRSHHQTGVALQSVSDIAQWTMRFRLAVLGIIFVSAFLASALLLCIGPSDEIRLQADERQILESRYLNYAGQVDLLPVYRQQSEIILERFGELLDAIPASLESVHVLSQLNKAAKEAGLHLELFKPLVEEAHGYYIVLPIEIRLRGDYNAIARFLELVSKMQHLVTVDVVILPAATHENQVVLASLLKAYRYKDLPLKLGKKAAHAAP